VGFITDLENVGNALKKGQDAWEAAKNKLHIGTGNLVRQAELLRELGVKASKAMPPQIKANADDDLSIPQAVVPTTDAVPGADSNNKAALRLVL